VTLPDVVVPLLLGLAAAAGVAAAATGVVGRRRREFEVELRGWRDRQSALDEISEVWQWQTNAAHRLVLLRTPAPGSGQHDDAASAPFWQRFGSPGSTELEARMKSGAALDDLDLDADAWHEKKRSFRLRGRALRDANGAFAGYVGTLREIVADPVAPAPVVPAASSVPAPPAPFAAPSEADHEALGTLVSHDLRAPIRVVEGFTRIVKEDYANVLDGIGHDHLDRVLGAAGRMNHMIDVLLALSRLASQPIARVPVDLSQLAGYVVEDLRRLRPEHVVEVEIEPGLMAQGDPTLLRMVLENLLGNAWKYTGNSSCAKVSFVRDADDADTFVVRDNGAGFDMRYADRLFGVFQRLHSASEFPGTGVGLASVRRIVRRHGGEIRAEGEPDRGASFHFSLPPLAAEA
jgi:signal transduction histidine kinase